MDPIKKTKNEQFEKALAREIATQIPTHVTKDSYQRMLLHCSLDRANKNLWCCIRTGAQVKARLVVRDITDPLTHQLIDRGPVAELYCSACDKPPVTRKYDPITSDKIQTVSM